MPLPPRRSLLLLIFGATAFAAGWWGAQRAAPGMEATRANHASAAAPASAALRAENTRLRDDNERLRSELARAERAATPAVAPARETEDRLRSLAELLRRPGAQVRFKIVGAGGKLDAGFAEAFGLQPAEAAQLEAALAEAKRAVEELIASHMTVHQTVLSTPGAADVPLSYEVTVPPFDGGREVYALLLQRFEATLGPDRGAMFRALEDEQLTRYLSHYGTEERRIKLTQYPTPVGAPLRFGVKEETLKDADVTQSFTLSTQSLEALKTEYGVLLRDLPPTFGVLR